MDLTVPYDIVEGGLKVLHKLIITSKADQHVSEALVHIGIHLKKHPIPFQKFSTYPSLRHGILDDESN